MYNIISGVIYKASKWGWTLASGCILAIVAMIMLEIGLKAFTGRSTLVAEEFSGYLLAWFAFLALAETLRTDGHVRVNIVISRLGRKPAAALGVLANALGLAVFAYLAFYLGEASYNSWQMGVQSMHLSRTPLFIPKIVPVIGSVLMSMQFLVHLLENLSKLFEPGKKGGSHG